MKPPLWTENPLNHVENLRDDPASGSTIDVTSPLQLDDSLQRLGPLKPSKKGAESDLQLVLFRVMEKIIQ